MILIFGEILDHFCIISLYGNPPEKNQDVKSMNTDSHENVIGDGKKVDELISPHRVVPDFE